jgi:hypothetical protein
MDLCRSLSTLPIILSLGLCVQVCAQTVERPEFKEGDTWTYHIKEGPTCCDVAWYYTETHMILRSLQRAYELSVARTAGRSGEQTTRTYRISRDTNLWARSSSDVPAQEARAWQWPLEPGKTWRYDVPTPSGTQTWEARVDAWEETDVPAGKFRTLLLSYELIRNPDPVVGRLRKVWYSPDAKVVVKFREYGTYNGRQVVNNTRELQSYQLH